MKFFVVQQNQVPKKLASVGDPAVLKETEEHKKGVKRYRETLDLSCLKLDPAQKPLIFHCQALSAQELEDARFDAMAASEYKGKIATSTATSRLFSFAFFKGVSRIENATVSSEEGEKTGDLPREMWYQIPSEMRAEIGQYIVQMSQAPSEMGKS